MQHTIRQSGMTLERGYQTSKDTKTSLSSSIHYQALLIQYSSADKRRVYLAYRTVFAGLNAQLRKPKKVREVIEARQNAFSPLIKDFGLEKVIEIVIILLNGWVFQSELKAKIAFPKLFWTTLSRDEQHAASENDAVRSKAEALEDLLSAEEVEERDDNRRDEEKGEDKTESKPSHNPCASLPSCIIYFYEQLNQYQLRCLLFHKHTSTYCRSPATNECKRNSQDGTICGKACKDPWGSTTSFAISNIDGKWLSQSASVDYKSQH
jgi:hypothetical protein